MAHLMMMNKGHRPRRSESNGEFLGFGAKRWAAADALRNNMDVAEYEHVVLRLSFFKYISDAFEPAY